MICKQCDIRKIKLTECLGDEQTKSEKNSIGITMLKPVRVVFRAGNLQYLCYYTVYYDAFNQNQNQIDSDNEQTSKMEKMQG